MVIATILAFFVTLRWGWSPGIAAGLGAMFLTVDLAFVGANLFKFLDGGWYPLVVAVAVLSTMGIWRSGLRRLNALTRETTRRWASFSNGCQQNRQFGFVGPPYS